MQKIIDADLSPLDLAILHTVIYADVFDYPLKLGEMQRYLTGLPASVEAVGAARRKGGPVPGLLNYAGGDHFLPGGGQSAVRRPPRGQNASRFWPQGRPSGGRIARLPFVPLLAVPGS